jgi:glycosyltransferase involved in cell wall biosynthesis
MTPKAPGSRAGLVLVSKSSWEPAMRREHAFARLAAERAYPVWFVERPEDARALADRAARRRLLTGLAGRGAERPVESGLWLVPTAAPIPGHRSNAAERLATGFLRRDLRRLVARAEPRAIVATAPWQWPAVRALADVRRVFDAADDWRALLPRRRTRIEAFYRQVAREADAIILASEHLRPLFAPRSVAVIPNAASDEVLAPHPTPAPGARRLVYVGTLSPRFDAPLVADLLRELPNWRLELYGPCQYPAAGDRPDAELRALLNAFPHRVAWHGVIPRSAVATAIDRADVTLVPNRPVFSGGQDSMKIYDYAARGRPIVVTDRRLAFDDAVGVRCARTPNALARAVIEAAQEPAGRRQARRAWAATQRWSTRWPAWSAAVLGPGQRVRLDLHASRVPRRLEEPRE